MPTRLALTRLPSLLRALAASAVLAAAAGCTQSLFDSDPGDDPADGPGDGDDDQGDGPDSGPSPGVDAAPTAECPAPCAGDAVADFGDSQGGSNGRWSYLADRNEANGAGYDELGFDSWNGLDAWVGEGGGPVIARCAGDAAECAGLDGFLLLVQVEAGGQRPAISFRVPEDATYQVSGAIRIADGEVTDVPVDLVVSRAGRHDALAAQTIRTSTEERAVDARFPGLAGDEITVSIGSDQATPPLGVRLFLTRDDGDGAFPGSCQMAVRFDGKDALVDGCRGTEIEDLNDGIGPPGTSVAGEGPSARLGQGRVFDEGQYLALGNSPLDYDGDFTIQFWARIQEPLLSFDVALYADWNSAGLRGLGYFMDDESDLVQICRFDPQSSGSPIETICLNGTRPTDSEWHFWRLVRSTSDGYLRLCIDGVENVQSPLPGNVLLTSDEPPRVGRNVVYEPAYFAGSFDEIRVFSEALPCPSN